MSEQTLAELQQALADANARIAALTAPVAEPAPLLEPRVYHSSTPFIRVPIMRAPGYCDSVQFVGGSLETTDPLVAAVMDAAVASGGSGFYHSVKPAVSEDVLAMQADLKQVAESAQTKMVKAGLTTK